VRPQLSNKSLHGHFARGDCFFLDGLFSCLMSFKTCCTVTNSYPSLLSPKYLSISFCNVISLSFRNHKNRSLRERSPCNVARAVALVARNALRFASCRATAGSKLSASLSAGNRTSYAEILTRATFCGQKCWQLYRHTGSLLALCPTIFLPFGFP
jgi:hypothetical protein